MGALGCRRGLLILPAASDVPPPVVQAIAGWAHQGGRLVLVGECLHKDERNRSLIDLRSTDGSALRVEASGDPTTYASALEPVFQATVGRAHRAVNENGQPLDGVEMRTAAQADGRLFYAINMNKTAVVLDIAPRPAGTLLELRRRRRVDLPVSLQPLDVLVLRAGQ